MKKIISSALALLLLAVLAMTAMVSCTDDDSKTNGTAISGTYSNLDSGTGVTFEFSSDMNVKITRQSTYRTDLEASGTYSIADGKITITYNERTTGSSETAEKYSGELTYESGDGFIKINGVEYKKA